MAQPVPNASLNSAYVARPASQFLDALRASAMRARAAPRTTLFEACALLHAERSATGAACADALTRCLPEALGRRPQLHAPGVRERSFDEDWLVALGDAATRNDDASIAFLLASRVGRTHRRLVQFLVRRAALDLGAT